MQGINAEPLTNKKTGILIMLTKVKACANLFVPLIGVVASVLFMGCSSLRLRKKVS